MKGFGHVNYIKDTEKDAVKPFDDEIEEAVDVDEPVEEPLVEVKDVPVEEEVEETVEEAVEETSDLIAVAKDVMRGMYGNGARRERLLREAGFDPDEVQKVVNTLIP